MNETPLQSFIELVSFDQGTYAIEDSIETIKKEIEFIKQNEKKLFEDLEFVKHNLIETRKDVDKAELKMKELERQEKEESKRLDQVKNQKEYKAISQEIKELKKIQHDYEEILIVIWNKFEFVKKEYEAKGKFSESKSVELKTAIDEKQKKLDLLNKDLVDRINQRKIRKKDIPKEWMEKYILMRSRVSDPVVPVVGGNCTACFYNLPPQDFLELRRNKMIQCKGCYRFLYIDSSD